MAEVYEALDSEIGDAASQEIRQEAESTSMILVLGETGAGKSHFINTLVPGSCKTSPLLTSCTSKPSAVALTFDGQSLLLIDTPGFNDTKSSYDRSDAVVLAEIAEMISVQTALGVQMKGVLYLHDINIPRMTGEAIRQLKLLQKSCGEYNFDHVAFVTTKWPDIATQTKMEYATRESELRRKFWRPMLSAGSRMYRFEEEEQATSIVRSMIVQPPVEFALQKELAKNGSLAGTAAGQFVIAARQEDEEKIRALTDPKAGRSKRDALMISDDEISQLRESINNRKKSEGVLNENINDYIKEKLEETVKEEYRKTGKRPSVATIISILVSIGSFAANLVSIFT